MVNPESPTFKVAEKVGLIVGKGMRVILLAGLTVIVARAFGSSTSPPAPNPPTPPAS